MKSCKNCYWQDKCPDAGKRCEYYDPVEGADTIVMREYHRSLCERGDEYRKLAEEQQGIEE